ncbi:hypothetical protein LTR86_005069 [Recurvomyces mirabilis]|nr:hypothetical protein LTR86_005069 [Recurvomyces mirabilis]
MSGTDDADENRRRFQAPYTPKHQIPTIQKYEEEKEERKALGGANNGDNDKSSWSDRAREYWRNDKENGKPKQDDDHGANQEEEENKDYQDEEPMVDTSEAGPKNSKDKRKGMKKRKDDAAERQVTDPITHLPVTIHDFTSQALKDVPENEKPMGTTQRSATGLSNKNKTNQELQKELHEMEHGRESTKAMFPPPEYNSIKQELADINKLGTTFGLIGAMLIVTIAFGLEKLMRSTVLPKWDQKHSTRPYVSHGIVWTVLSVLAAGTTFALVKGVRDWMERRLNGIWDDEIWEANRAGQQQSLKAHENESVSWLNALMSSVWPLVNPDLFTSLADTLEDVMQASLPSLVQMVSVDDVGQGSESLRILGIKWLPTGAAARSVGKNGKLKSKKESKKTNDRSVPGEGEVDDDAEDGDKEDKDGKSGQDDKDNDDGTEAEQAEGMEAEEGDFINLEVSFAYRARSNMKTMKERSKDAHLYLAFYLPGNLKVPVWVDLRGIVGTVRLRLQLAPDPPFFALCTLTFLGQPKVDISCTPLIRSGINLMDLPLISNFVQSSVDAAMAEYVAPKSLTLDLKDMLAGDDFRKDTSARGVLVVNIRRGYDFQAGDPGIPLIKEGGSDPYVSVGWAKFGKPMWSSRLLEKEMEPVWNECTYLLVTPEELNVNERLRVQLWDADRFTADDDLGRIELDLKQLMRGEETNGRMQRRQDGFRALKAGEDMPGKLEWDVGYYSKARLQKCQLERQTVDPSIRSMDQLQKKVDETCENKLREANIKKGRHSRDQQELEQQKAQEMKAQTDAMMISAPPPEGYPSGVFSIQIHQITGLELEKTNKNQTEKDTNDHESQEEGDHLPSAYCTVIINHNKVFKTRTKPKNARPFYNAGVERYIPDWQNCEVYVSVRDARVKEDDPLLGIVHLPLSEVFKDRSQVNGFYPLMGGVGYGRIRISMVWRSVQLKAPPQELGWGYGTLEIHSGVESHDLLHEYSKMKIRFHSDITYAKIRPTKEDGHWDTKRNLSLKLPYKKRYASCLALEFRKKGIAKDKTAAFATYWLREIPDEVEKEIDLPVYTGNFARARVNCLDQPGEKIGTIKLRVTFWSGLGGAHSSWASKDAAMRDVVEVLQVSRDQMESLDEAKKAGIVDEEDTSGSSDSSSDDDDDEDKSKQHNGENGKGRYPSHNPRDRIDGGVTLEGEEKDGAAADGKGNEGEQGGGQVQDVSKPKKKHNIIDAAKDYKKHMKSEHRRHHGIMQWKIPRTAQWGVHKVEHAGQKVGNLLKMHTKQPGIETEV